MSIQTVNDQTYKFPVKPRIKIFNLDGDLLHTFDAFSGSNPFAVVSADVENAQRETGVFQVVIHDKENVLDMNTLRDAKVTWELGKSAAEYKFFLTGFADFFDYDNPIDNYHQYIMSGYGSWIQSSELFLLKRKASKIQDVTNKKVTPDPEYAMNRLLKDSFNQRGWRPRDIDESVKHWTGWVDTGVSSKFSINRPVVNLVFVKFKEWCDQLGDESGAAIFLDYSFGIPERLTALYSPELHTGVTIKSGDFWAPTTDPANKTSYYKVPFRLSFDSSSGAGVANALYTSNIQDSVSVASSFVNKGSQTLNNRAIAQQVKITADTKHIDGAAFIMRKIGEPASPKDRINFDIVTDNANKPTGKVVETFEIPISSVKDNSDTIFVTELDLKESALTGSEPVIWIRAFQRSGLKGDPVDDPANTIAWHHNNIFNTVQTLRSATAPGGDRDKKDSLSWTVSDKGPVFCFGLFSDIRRILSRVHLQSFKFIRRKEEFIDSSALNDPTSINRLLALQMTYTSKTRLQAPEFMASIPNNFIFRPYQVVTLVTPKFAADLSVQRARYSFGAIKGESAVGASHCFITLGGSYNPLISSCSCE